MDTKTIVEQFFGNFGIKPGGKYKPISLARYIVVIEAAARWFGANFGQWVSECFLAEDGTRCAMRRARSKCVFTYPTDFAIERLDRLITKKQKAQSIFKAEND